ncbi:PREDICTED: interferon lambda-4-like [Chrysochloris asiatica]|uniref:Interferon lambda-4-like n=1 Tax=Chrysochloris asiatica TaxID=185453 RepID=A0A9B0U970_CHRAS|nr:PREDICTED: interferon lambda-4-like [Chrysochloris asiatica]
MERPDTTPEGGHPSRGHPVRRGGQAQRQKEGGSKGALQVRIQEREAPGAEMGTRVGAAVAVGLWVSVTMGVASDLGVREPQRCLLSRYRSLDPRALAAVKELTDRYEEETLSWRPRNCSFRPWKELPKPGSCARLRLVARDLADAQLVLSSQRNSELLPGTGPTLQLLAAARRDVGTCLELFRPGSSRKSLGPPRRRHKARRDESPRCREAAVILTLLRLLLRDLRLVAHSEPCV